MPGLLGDGFDDPRSAAIMALSGGLLSGNFGQGLLGAQQAYQGSQDGALKRKLTQAQLDNYASEIEARKLATIKDARQQKLVESFFPGMNGGPAVPAGPGAGPGAFQLSPDGMGLPGGPPAPPGGNDILALAQKFGIPPQAIQADMVFNGGKKISEMLAKQGTPDMQVTNGYAYDKNRVGAGFMPQLTSQDNKTSMVRIGADGLPVVSAPTGALNTFASYQNVQEGTKANYDPVTVTPEGQNPQMTTRGALVSNPLVNGRKINPASQSAMDTGRTETLQAEVVKAQAQLNRALAVNDQSAAARAQSDLAGLNRELGGKRPSVGMPLQSDEQKLRAEQGVKADASHNADVSKQAGQSRDMGAYLGRAKELLGQGPTASGFGSMVDGAAGFVGKSTNGADVASGLDTISGWLTANVPRMEGPQSNFDVLNYQTMAGKVGNRNLPVSQRMSAVQELEKLQQKYAPMNAGMTNQVGGTGAPQTQEKANVIDTLPKMAPKGQRMRDTTTGKVLKFNGISWAEEK